MTTPAWQAPLNGLPSNQRASLSSAHLNQLLSTHAITEIYEGAVIIHGVGRTNLTWLPMPDSLDFSQPVTMSGTTIGRVQLPLLPVGNGADVLVQLWPDNGSGAPNTTGNPLAATLLPAGYTNQIAAANGLENPPSALATPLDNEYAYSGGTQGLPWLAPAGDATGSIANSVLANTSDTMLFLGGVNGSGTILANCASTTAVNGSLAQPVPQPPLPQATEFGGAAVVNNNTVVYLGGTITGTPAVTNTWAASWDPGNHVIGAWSAQTPLPTAIQHSAVCAWGNTVYSIGGANASNTAQSVVYFASITNNQVGSWQTGSPLPTTLTDGFAAAVAGWLIVAGGRLNFSSAAGQSVYYAKILPDGSLGPWQTGPSLPNAEYAFASGWGVGALPNAFVQAGGDSDTTGAIQILSVTSNGPASFWRTYAFGPSGDLTILPVALGNGQYSAFCPVAYASTNYVSTIAPMPYVSVPLYATGLTNSATYHIVLRAFSASSASDGMQLGTLGATLPVNTLQAPRYGTTWSTISSGFGVPLRAYDTSVTGTLRHLVQDVVGGMVQQWSSVFYNGQKLLAGAAEVTMHPNVPLNSNPTFTSGVSPWTAANGTVTQSSAQVHGGFAFSGLLTPTGGFTQAYALSELIPVTQTPYGAAQWLLVNGWFYTPTTWANFDLSVFWFDQGGTFISSSDLNTSLTGATWTQESHYVTPPATAAQARILPILNGSPTSAQLLYMSNVTLQLTPESVGALTSAATVNYGTNPWPPTGVTQLN